MLAKGFVDAGKPFDDDDDDHNDGLSENDYKKKLEDGTSYGFGTEVKTVDQQEMEHVRAEIEDYEKSGKDHTRTERRMQFWRKQVLHELSKLRSSFYRFAVAVANNCQFDSVNHVLVDIPNHYANSIVDGEDMLKGTILKLLNDLPNTKSDADLEMKRTMIRIILNVANRYRDVAFSSGAGAGGNKRKRIQDNYDTDEDDDDDDHTYSGKKRSKYEQKEWLKEPLEIVSDNDYTVSGKYPQKSKTRNEINEVSMADSDDNVFLIGGNGKEKSSGVLGFVKSTSDILDAYNKRQKNNADTANNKEKQKLEKEQHESVKEEKKRQALFQEKELVYKKEKDERGDKNARRLQKEKNLLQLHLKELETSLEKDKMNRKDAGERHKRETEKSKELASLRNKNDQYNNLRRDLAGLFEWLNGWEDDLNEDKRQLQQLQEDTFGTDGISGIMFFTDEISGIICSARDKINVFANKDFTLRELIESEGIYTFFASYVGCIYRSLKFNEFESQFVTIHYSGTRYGMAQKEADNIGAVQFFSNVKRVPILDKKGDPIVGKTVLVLDRTKNAESANKTWPWQRPTPKPCNGNYRSCREQIY